MAKKSISLSLVGVVVALMTFTNPSKSFYLEYSKAELCRRGKGPYKNLCKTVIFVQDKNIEKLIRINTNRKNLLIGSFYTTEMLGVKVHTVGMFGNFLTLP